ncbi:MAG: lysostaphin resistance A-like protein [Halobacteriaceae archaeon]
MGRLRTTAVAVLLGVGGIFVMVLWVQALAAALGAVGVTTTPGTPAGELLAPVATLAGAASVAAYYLRLSRRGMGFLDIRFPDRRDAAHAAAGLVAIVALALATEAVMESVGVAGASHATVERARTGDAAFLLVLIPAALLFIGPGEELLYRNLVQKLLAEVFPAWRAIALTSALFALVHVGVLAAGDSSAAVAASLAVAFLLSLVLGVVYHRTRNVVVAALVHGGYDAVVFGALYVQYA